MDKKSEPLHHTLFQPEDGKVRATLLILHGMMEHSGRYEGLARFLSARGFAVMAYDHPGHGHTASGADDLGFFQDKDPAGRLIGDALQMAEALEEKFPGIPHFILGHSMGSFIARCLLQQATNRFDGAVMVGTGGSVPVAKLGRAALSLLNSVAPKHRSPLIHWGFNWMNNRHFNNEQPRDGTNWLSRDKENRARYLQDPLCGKPFTNNGYYGLLSLVVRATGKQWARLIPKNLPMLFVSGEDDPIGDFGKGVSETVRELRQDGFEHIKLQLYPGMRHEILNESIKQQVYGDVAGWLDAVAEK